MADHDCSLHLVDDPHTRRVHIEIRTELHNGFPSLYAGCKLSSLELDQPNALLDAVERLVEQIERASKPDSQDPHWTRFLDNLGL
jgi:hypothetical protein